MSWAKKVKAKHAATVSTHRPKAKKAAQKKEK